jgi:putative ABC transport system permease protein
MVGATVMSMLLNLYGGVRRSMTQEFRAYGANVVLAPRLLPATEKARQGWGISEYTAASNTMDQAVMGPVEEFARQRRGVTALPVLYGVVRLKPTQPDPRLPDFVNVVAVGTDLGGMTRMNPGWRESRAADYSGSLPPCLVGARVASRLRVVSGGAIYLEPADSSLEGGARASATCHLTSVLATGSSEDDQAFLPLEELQRVMGMPGKISLVQLRLEGERGEIESSLHRLSKALPGLDVRPIRQIVYSEGRVLGVIRWFLLSVTSLILIIIIMCLMATMTAIALERRKDIGVMKSLGATDLQVMRLFMAEGAALGIIGGAIGCFVGSGSAISLARHLFGVTINVIWWTSPLICSFAALLAMGAALILVRTVRAIEPAVVLRGE